VTVYHAEHDVTLHQGHVLDVLPTLPTESANCVVTSPPYYGLRDYGVEGQIGLEASPAEYVETMRRVFAEVRRVLRPDGVLWLNLGDSYARGNTGQGNDGPASSLQGGIRPSFRNDKASVLPTKRVAGMDPKNLLGVPWRVAFALQDDGWTLRNDVIWSKPNAMPESVTDRLACRYEHVFLFSKSRRYWFDLDPIREPLAHPDAADGTRIFGGKQGGDGKVGSSFRTAGGMPNAYGGSTWEQRKASGEASRHGLAGRSAAGGKGDMATNPRGRNPGDVWTIPTAPYPAAHFATFPPELARRCIAAGCPPDGTVLDPFTGSGTTLMVARRLLRKSIGIELNAAYCELIVDRIGQPIFDFGEATA